MRSWTVGLLCLGLAVFVAARFPYLKAKDVDAELEALEAMVNARNEVAIQKREEELRKLGVDGLTNDQLQELLDELDSDDDIRELERGGVRKRSVRSGPSLWWRRRRRSGKR